jgi:hypothetical protein
VITLCHSKLLQCFSEGYLLPVLNPWQGSSTIKGHMPAERTSGLLRHAACAFCV